MQPNDKPKEKGRCAARVEFLAVQEDVQRFLGEGHSLRAIYDFFQEKGTFTMRYNTFCRYARGQIPTAGPRKKRVMFSQEANSCPAPAAPSAVKIDERFPERTFETVPEQKNGPQVIEAGNSKTVDPKQYDSTDLT